jgi:UDP-N-acetylglucosamine:LPS N-acetylglucosamine transferase
MARRPQTTGLDYRVVAFGDMVTWWSVADVAVCRAGATTLAEVTLLGIPAVVVPLPGAPGDHQTRNASVLASAHAAVMVADRDCSATSLADALTPLFDPSTRAHMADASRALGHPDAARAIATVVREVAK